MLMRSRLLLWLGTDLLNDASVDVSWRSDFWGSLTKAWSQRPRCGVSCERCVWSVQRPPPPPSDSPKDIKPEKYLLVSVSHTSEHSESVGGHSQTGSVSFGFLFATLSSGLIQNTNKQLRPCQPNTGSRRCVISHISLFIFIGPVYILPTNLICDFQHLSLRTEPASRSAY